MCYAHLKRNKEKKKPKHLWQPDICHKSKFILQRYFRLPSPLYSPFPEGQDLSDSSWMDNETRQSDQEAFIIHKIGLLSNLVILHFIMSRSQPFLVYKKNRTAGDRGGSPPPPQLLFPSTSHWKYPGLHRKHRKDIDTFKSTSIPFLAKWTLDGATSVFLSLCSQVNGSSKKKKSSKERTTGTR